MHFLGLYLDRLDSIVYTLATACIAIAAGSILFRRLRGHSGTPAQQEMTGHYFAVVSTIYAVTLGLVVFDALGTYEQANETVKKEAKSLFAVYALAGSYSDEDRRAIQNLTRDYVDAVLNSEWQLMDNRDECPLSRKLMFDLIDRVNHITPATPSQTALLPLIAGEMINAVDSARSRLQQNAEGIPDIEWYVLITGGAFTILFSYFFDDRSIGHFVMSCMLALVIGSNLLLVLAFGEPFRGGFQVSNQEFVMLKQYISAYQQ